MSSKLTPDDVSARTSVQRDNGKGEDLHIANCGGADGPPIQEMISKEPLIPSDSPPLQVVQEPGAPPSEEHLVAMVTWHELVDERPDWTVGRIDEFLVKPDKIITVGGDRQHIIELYSEVRVQSVEATPDFANAPDEPDEYLTIEEYAEILRRLDEERRILAAADQAEALTARACRAWKTRAKRRGEIAAAPFSACIEAYGGRPYVVLRAEAGVVAEYSFSSGRLRFVEVGPARKAVERQRRAAQEQAERQRRAAQEQAELESIRTADLGVLLPRALECLHALNRYAKHASSLHDAPPAPRSARDPYDRPETMRDRIYSVKDRFLVTLVRAGKAQVFSFQETRESRWRTCRECGREWSGGSYCYECDEQSGIALIETVNWYVIESDPYRFHQPRVPQDVAALATEIEPHDPTQPTREVPDVGLSRAGQLECVELATTKLEAAMQASPLASPET